MAIYEYIVAVIFLLIGILCIWFAAIGRIAIFGQTNNKFFVGYKKIQLFITGVIIIALVAYYLFR